MKEKWEYETNDQIDPPVKTQGEQYDPANEPDWDDDSGAIHTVKHSYKITKEDGWQNNRGYSGAMLSHQGGAKRPQKIKGTQIGVSYTTDDYRVVIPAMIIFLIIMLAICVVVTILIPPMGIFFDVIALLAVIGIIRQRPDKKWRNQAKRLREEKGNAADRE